MNHDQSGQLPEDQSTGHTLREIADAIGVDKSTVFRYVQRCNIAPIDATQRCKRYSATAENDIIQHFATMRNDSATMRERLAMMRNSSGNDTGNDAQSVQRCNATTPDSSGELDAIRAELDDLRRELSTEREHSRATAEKLAQLTDQAQQLQAAQIQRASAPLPIESADDQTEDTRPSLWARIFGKK